jgi:TolA-binding protein
MGKKQIMLIYVFILHCATFTITTNLTAQYEEDKAFIFMKEMFDRHDKKLQDFLVIELTHYINTFPDGVHSEDARYMLSKVYEEKGDKNEAIASFLKMIYLYPNSSKKAEWADLVRNIVANEKKYGNKKTEIFTVIEQQMTDRTATDRYFDYLLLLKTLDQSKLYDWFLSSCREFITLYSDDNRNDQVTLWIAETYSKKKKNEQAEASYLKFNLLFTDSPLLPQAIYKRGALLYDKLKKSDLAIEELNRVVAEYPESTYAAEALFKLATIKEKKLKEYQAAMTDYRKLTDLYPNSPKAFDALFRVADLYKGKLKDYPAAVTAYNEIVTKDSVGAHGPLALEEIATIYKRNLKDQGKAAETYKQISDTYPTYDKAADRLYEAGMIYERKIKDQQKAIEYYQLVVEKYPTHKKARDAKKRLSKME